MRSAKIFYRDRLAGVLKEDDAGYEFVYDLDYLASEKPKAVSLTLPLSDKVYKSNVLFPCFDGLIPEGWLLDVAANNWKLNPRDRMGLLLACCKDCIGTLSVVPLTIE